MFGGNCPQHGPYQGTECPYCSGSFNRPPAPQSLEDDLPTDLRGAQARQVPYNDDSPTDLRGGRGGVEPTTQIGANRPGHQKGQKFNYDEEAETSIGRDRIDDHTELEDTPTGVLGLLWVKKGKQRGRIYQVKNGTIVGRTQGSLVLGDPKVSDQHAKFVLENDHFVIWDFGSSNGTYVNNERIRAATPLEENAEIRMGDTVFLFKMLPEN